MSGTVVYVTSGKGGTGKSTVAHLLAASAVQLGLRTVLIDVNLWNPSQASLNSVRFAEVPARMPTVLDDAHPSQWWMDPLWGFQTVPGPRSWKMRQQSVVVPRAVRVIERARTDRDLVVVDAHQVGNDTYTSTLIDLADLFVGVCGTAASSRDNLRSWLDAACAEPDADSGDPRRPELDASQVRLLFVEHSNRRDRASMWSAAKAEMGVLYPWAGRIEFDDGLAAGGDAGDLLGGMSRRTRTGVTDITSRIVGVPVPVAPRSGPRERGQHRRPYEAPPPLPSASIQFEQNRPDRRAAPAAAATAVTDERLHLSVLGVPSLSGDTVDEIQLAVTALVAMIGLVTPADVAEILDVPTRSAKRYLASCRGLREVTAGVWGRAWELTVDADEVRRAADALTTALGVLRGREHGLNPGGAPDDKPTADLADALPRAFEVLGAAAGNVLDVDTSMRCWSWVLHTAATGSANARATVMGELMALTAITSEASSLCPDVVASDLLVDVFARLALGAASVGDPRPLLEAASRVADNPGIRSEIVACSADLEIGGGSDLVAPIERLLHRIEDLRANPVLPATPPRLSVWAPPAGQPTQLQATTVTGVQHAEMIGQPRSPEAGPDVVLVQPTAIAPSVVSDTRLPHRAVGAERGWRVLLRTCGPIDIVGADRPRGSLPVPWILGAFQRPMTPTELASILGAKRKTIVSNYPASSSLVEREGDTMRLADGVWTDTSWMVHCESSARAAIARSERDVATRWINELIPALQQIECGPYRQPPERAEWRWVDEWPESLPARAAAEGIVADVAISAIDLAATLGLLPDDPTESIALLCRVAAEIPFAPVRRRNLTPYTTSAHALLHAAARLATGDRASTAKVEHQVALLEQSHRLSDVAPLDDLADLLGVGPAA